MNTNYQIEMEKIIDNLKERKKLLIHSCCGPCSSYVLEYLNKYFDITILYFNSNIYPEAEYKKRLDEQKRLVSKAYQDKIKVVEIGYDHDEYLEYIKGHEEDTEGGERCHLCYKYRMEKACIYTKDNNFDYFTTTLSVSPYKNSKVLNEIGKQLEDKYKMKYLYADFKKKNGYKRSIEISKEYDLYRQNYCGCEFSLRSEIYE